MLLVQFDIDAKAFPRCLANRHIHQLLLLLTVHFLFEKKLEKSMLQCNGQQLNKHLFLPNFAMAAKKLLLAFLFHALLVLFWQSASLAFPEKAAFLNQKGLLHLDGG